MTAVRGGIFMKKERRASGFIKVLAIVIAVTATLMAASAVFICVFSARHVDSERDELLFQAAKSGNITTFFAVVNGEETQIGELSLADGKKTWYPEEEIPETLKKAFVSAEDRRFYSHGGFDVKRLAGAALGYITGRSSYGGSTITQQVIKNISGDSERTVNRKLSEIIRAVRLERRHTKSEILEVYMNIVPLGENAVGVGRAAYIYFGKEPAELTLAEAATLVGITNAPTKYNPYINPEECVKKRNTVLYTMLDCGEITEEEYNSACEVPLTLSERGEHGYKVNSWFIETVCTDIVRDLMSRRGMSEGAARTLLECGGLKIITTENPEVQEILEKFFTDERNLPDEISNGLQIAMSVSDSSTGELVGIIGQCGVKGGNKLANHAIIPHTPGSSLKPLALYAPLIDSRRISVAEVFDDVPQSFTAASMTPYPHNSPDVYDGLITVRDALAKSKNTVALKLSQLRGLPQIYRDLNNDFGFTTLVNEKQDSNGRKLTDIAAAPLALGQLTDGLPLRELTHAYTVFPGDGSIGGDISYYSVSDLDGNILLENKPAKKRIYSEEAARVMCQALSGVTEFGTAAGVRLKYSVDTAGKTGTSGGDLDRLFIGFTPYYTAGIWCGYAGEREPRSLGRLSRSHVALWDDVMCSLHNMAIGDSAPRCFSTDGLVHAEFCRDSGKRCTLSCALDPRGERAEDGYFIPGTEPTEECDTHITVLYDTLTSAIACPCCPDEYLVPISLVKVPERKFPCEITVTDAEYAYYVLPDGAKAGDSYDIPYYIYTIPDGVYVGRGKRKKQYNSYCYIHSDGYSEHEE